MAGGSTAARRSVVVVGAAVRRVGARNEEGWSDMSVRAWQAEELLQGMRRRCEHHGGRVKKYSCEEFKR
jgi:hypothetical protein